MKISTQINYTIILAISLVMMIVYGISYNIRKAELQDYSQIDATLLVERLTTNLVSPIWSYNDKDIATVVLTEMKSMSVVCIKINDDRGQLLFGANKDADGNVVRFGNDYEFNNNWDGYPSEIINTKIYYGESFIGNLSIKLTKKHMQQALSRLTYGTTIQTVVLALVMILLLTFLIRRIVVKPINKYAILADSFQENRFDIRSDYHGNDELSVLSDTFNKMVGTIENYSEKMEETVSKRTKELLSLNRKLKDINQRVDNELMMARNIQRAIIPENLSRFTRFDLAGYSKTADALGGDYYDVIKISEDKIALIVADVCGHGVPAAMVTMMAKISFQRSVMGNDNPIDVIKSVNLDLCKVIGNKEYLAAFYAEIDLKTNTLTYVNAALTDVLLVKQNGEFVYLKPNSSVIGYREQLPFKSDTVNLNGIETLVVYTDGITEHRCAEKLYGYKGVGNIIKENLDKDAQGVVDAIISDLDSFASIDLAMDDLTLFVLKRK